MLDAIIEETIRLVFGDNWLVIGIVIVAVLVTIAVIRFARNNRFPVYFRNCLVAGVIEVAALIEVYILGMYTYSGGKATVEGKSAIGIAVFLLLLALIFTTIATLVLVYYKYDKKLKYIVKNIQPDGNYIKAWKDMQNIKLSCLTPWQVKKYNKRRLYLRVVLGNMCGAEQELEQYQSDKSFYHYMKAVLLNMKGKFREEIKEEKLAEDYCNGDTEALLHFQIIANRGVGYVSVGEYRLANDCFKRAIDYGREMKLDNYYLWINTYYNYIFNLTRLDSELSINACLDMLKEVTEYIDLENPKQYLAYSNTVIELLRQMKADRKYLNQVINQDFEYLINAGLTDSERCVLEATTARMVCTGRLHPEIVIGRLSEDIEYFSQLPMPVRYRCFKEIDYMFKDLGGNLTKDNNKVKETAHWYIVNQAIYDLEKYRSELPSEAVYEICYCLKERAGLLKYNPERYDWNTFIKDMNSAMLLYKENELWADYALCNLNIVDEALSELNMDSKQESLYPDIMKASIHEVENILPELMEHPILNEIYLRLSIYCFAMNDIEKSRCYYEKYQKLGNFSLDHFAPWLRGRYSVLSLYMLVIGYIDTVDKIAGMNLDKEITKVQEWFKEFHNRNGYYEAIVFGRLIGAELVPMCINRVSGKQLVRNNVSGYNAVTSDIESAWMVIPALKLKIKCNGRVSGKVIGEGGLFSECEQTDLLYYNVNTIQPAMRSVIERTTQMIKAELPDYIVDSEEMNRLAGDNWFNISLPVG